MLIQLENVKQFDEEIKEGVVLVDFFASWCGPCKMLGPVLEAVADEVPEAKIVKVNVDEFPQLASKFSVYSIPTLVLFKNGKAVATHVGFINKEPLKKFIAQ